MGKMSLRRRFLKKGHSSYICPVCKDEMVLPPIEEEFANNPQKVREYAANMKKISRDHILPKERASSEYLHKLHILGVKTTKYVCADCNSSKGFGVFNHCEAALILDRLIKGDERFYRNIS